MMTWEKFKAIGRDMMTWKEFKAIAEANGIKDEMKIWYIDISFPEAKRMTIVPQSDSGENATGLTIST